MSDLRAKLCSVGLRVANEVGATRCRPFVVLEVGPARVDMDALHAQAQRDASFHEAMGGLPSAQCCGGWRRRVVRGVRGARGRRPRV